MPVADIYSPRSIFAQRLSERKRANEKKNMATRFVSFGADSFFFSASEREKEIIFSSGKSLINRIKFGKDSVVSKNL